MIKKLSVKLSDHHWRKLVKQAFERDNYTCQLSCTNSYTREQLHPHHIILKSRLRLDILENILTVCVFCHRPLHDGLLSVSVDDLIDQYGLRGYLKFEQDEEAA